MRKVVVLLGAVLTALALAGVPVLRAQDVPQGDAVEGKRLYLAVGCFLCHGRAGQGGALNAPAPSLAKTQLPFEGFKGQLRTPINDMPAYTDAVMPEKQVADIYAFVQSLSGPLATKDMGIFKD
jgi:mono/diheme cytochrome c family protein